MRPWGCSLYTTDLETDRYANDTNKEWATPKHFWFWQKCQFSVVGDRRDLYPPQLVPSNHNSPLNLTLEHWIKHTKASIIFSTEEINNLK